MGDDGNDGSAKASAFKAEETGERNGVLGRTGEGESASQVGVEAWLCDRGASTHLSLIHI